MNTMHRPGRSRVRDERGMGTVLVAGVCLGLVMVAATVALIVGWLARAERAQDVADLTALAAAAVEVDGGDACAEATKVASANGGRLTGCEVRGQRPRFVVEVTVALPLLEGRGFNPADVERNATAGTV